MKFVKPNLLIRSLYSSLIWKINTEEKVLYLTFDDGPIPEVTPWVLEQLRAYQAKATFFCVGENVEKHPEIFAQLKAEKHQIGHHTYHHVNGWKTLNAAYYEEVKKGNAAAPSALFRPPYGKLKRAQIKQLKQEYKLIMWDVLSYDFDKDCSEEACFEQVRKNAGKGSIVVFHDSIKANKNLRYALPKTLEYFSRKGFRFEALS